MSTALKRIMLVCAAGVIVLFAACLVRATRLKSRQVPVGEVHEESIDTDSAGRRLAEAIRFPTVSSWTASEAPEQALLGLRAHLERSFPLVHDSLSRELVAGHTLLYSWLGSDPTLAPAVLLAHQDVVPVVSGTEDEWGEEPFSGRIRDGQIWGRGTIDNKSALFGALEAIEALLAEGVVPARTVYLVASHDEEVRGIGARKAAELLASRGVRAEFVLDEGLLVSDGIVPGVNTPVALIGVAEKGFLAVELVAEAELGHVAFPPTSTPIGRLAAALISLERAPADTSLEGAPRELFEWLGADMTFGSRLIAANLWLFGPLVRARMIGAPPTAALLRSTSAITRLEAGSRLNVLPNRARATAVFFVHPSESTHQVLERVRRACGDSIEVRVLERAEPTPRAATDSHAFGVVARSIRETFPDALVAPSLLVGNVDARHYVALSDHVFRFTPIVATRVDLARIHGSDERIGLAAHGQVIRFYLRLLRNVQAP